MKLRALRIHDVRQFAGRGVALEGIADGLNSFAEPNEAGKSTLFAALQAVIFEKYTSAGKAIQSLRPYAGGNPRIAVDLETADGAFRVEKRFNRGPAFATVTDLRAGRVIAQKDEAQVWIDALLGDRDAASGPAGLLWVRQGDSGSLGGGQEARAGSLNAMVAGQLDAMTVGARMQSVMARTAEELGALVTLQGRPRTGGALADAGHEVSMLAEREAGLAARVDALRRDLDRRQQLRRDLAVHRQEVPDLAAEQTRISTAEDAVRTSRARAARVPALEAQAQTVSVQLEALFREEERFRDASERVVAAMAEIAALDAGRAGQEAAALAASTALDTAASAFARAREAARAAERRWQHAHDARHRDDLADRLRERKAARAWASELDAAQRAAEAEAALSTLGKEDVARIVALEQAAGRAAERALATRTHIEVVYVPGAEGRITDGKAPVPDGVALDITAPLRLTVDGVGTVAITPGGGDQASEAQRAAEDARQALDAALAEAGVANAEAAREALAHRNGLLERAAQARAQLAILAPDGLGALADQVVRLETELTTLDDGVAGNPEEAGTAMIAAREALEVADRAHARATADRDETLAALEKAGAERAAQVAALAEALTVTGPQDLWPDRAEAMEVSRRDLTQKRGEIGAELTALADAPEQLALAEADLARLRKAGENRREAVRKLELELARIDERFRDAADDGIETALGETRDALDAARLRLGAIDLRVRALQALDTALKSAHRAMRETYFAPVNRELRPLLQRVLGGDTLEFGGDLSPHTLRRNGLDEEITRLSGGTQEQVAILTRLAFARLLAKNGAAAPVVLDDALIFSDDDRIEQMFTVLNAMTADLQIIVLTCRQRAFAAMGGTLLTLTEWTPQDA